MQRYEFDIIGTHLFIRIEIERDISGLFEIIEDFLRGFEQKFSRFLTGNWLHELNISRRATLDEDGQNMTSFMLDLARKTDGYFDPTVGKRLSELGYGRGVGGMRYEVGDSLSNIIPAKVGIQAQLFGDYRDIEMDSDQVILHGDILLEFGGVGKGYLIDKIRDMIENTLAPQDKYLINFGGDLFGRGGWKIGLESPFASDEVIGMIMLDRFALACSAGTKRKWGTHHHLIDPHTGESAREVVASYIESESALIADAYATTLCVMPWEKSLETLAQTREISGVIVRNTGEVYKKEGSRSELFQ